MRLETAEPGIEAGGVVTHAPLWIYAGLAGQIGDIVMYTATLRRLKELFPNSFLTCAVSRRYREAGELVEGLPYVDHLFLARLYFEKLTPALFQPWERGWPVDLRGEDEVAEETGYDLVFDIRPRHRRERWWEAAHLAEELAHMVGVPGPIDRRAEIAIPAGTQIRPDAGGKIVLHNDPAINPTKAWPWESVRELVARLGSEQVVLLGGPGPEVAGVLDLRGQTTLAEAAAIIRDSRCYVGIDSGLMWIAGSLQVPTVGLYGTSYIPVPAAVQPHNPRACYLVAQGGLDGIPVDQVLEAVQSAAPGRSSRSTTRAAGKN